MFNELSFFEIILYSGVIGCVFYYLYVYLAKKREPVSSNSEHRINSSNPFIYFNDSVGVRYEFIKTYSFPDGIKRKLKLRYPGLTDDQYNVGVSGLKQFFICHLNSKNQYIAMPSRFVDEIWHEFILDTKTYSKFSDRAFGKYLHHIPDSCQTSQSKKELGLLLAWELAQQDSRKRNVSNSLFEADSSLNINGSIDRDSIGTLKRKHSKYFSSSTNASNSSGADLLALSLLMQAGDLKLDNTDESTKKEATSSGCGGSFMDSTWGGYTTHDSHDSGSSTDSSDSGGGSSCGGGCGGGGD